MIIPAQLITLIRQETSRPVPSSANTLAQDILVRYGDAVQAILFYGSCFRKGDDAGGIVDFCLLVDAYRTVYRSHGKAWLNKLLPPNVYYIEVPFEGRVVRAKYAVLSLKDFQRGTSLRCFHPYFWARFAQPTGLLYARSNQVAEEVTMALARAVITFITRVLPRVTPQFTARKLWRQGFLLSYRTELRAERLLRLGHLFEAASEHYEQVTRIAMDKVPFSVEVIAGAGSKRYLSTIPSRVRSLSRFAWGARSLQGKWLSILRLLKGLFTFQGGLDYVLWKIERHSGIRAEIDPRMKRHPVLGVCVLFWRLYRRGAFR